MTKNCQHFTEPMKISLKFGQVTEFLLISVYTHTTSFLKPGCQNSLNHPLHTACSTFPWLFLPQTSPTIPHSSYQAQQETPIMGSVLPAWRPGCEAAATLKCTAMKNCVVQRSVKVTRVLKKPKRTERDETLGKEDQMRFNTTRTKEELKA